MLGCVVCSLLRGLVGLLRPCHQSGRSDFDPLAPLAGGGPAGLYLGLDSSTQVRACVHGCVHACVYMCMRVCVCVCVRARVYVRFFSVCAWLVCARVCLGAVAAWCRD
jgi:hypothetical protein